MADWLKNRLTPAKKGYLRWTELAEAIQQYWEENFDPAWQALVNLRSIYTTDEAGLKKRLDEWGDFFREASLFTEDKPLAVAWRKLELAFKDTAYIMELALKRKFPNLNVGWVPLYHNKNQPYGYEFISQQRLLSENRDPADYFLTSHGTVNTTVEDLDNFGLALADFAQQAYEQIVRIKPLHIVYHGVQVYTDIPFNAYLFTMTRTGGFCTIGIFTYTINVASTILRHTGIVRTAAYVTIDHYPES